MLNSLTRIKQHLIAVVCFISTTAMHAQDFLSYTSFEAQTGVDILYINVNKAPLHFTFTGRYAIDDRNCARVILKTLVGLPRTNTYSAYLRTDSMSNYIPDRIDVQTTSSILGASLGFEYILYGRNSDIVDGGWYFYTGLNYFVGHIKNKHEYSDTDDPYKTYYLHQYAVFAPTLYRMRGPSINLGVGYEKPIGAGFLCFDVHYHISVAAFLSRGRSSATVNPVVTMAGLSVGYRFSLYGIE